MRLIDADVLKKDLTRFYDNEVTAKQLIDEQPTIEPERKKGKWIADVDRWGDVEITVNGYICSECKVFNTDKDNYCPNCGCQMNGGEQSDTD